jgi:hypothetical protein
MGHGDCLETECAKIQKEISIRPVRIESNHVKSPSRQTLCSLRYALCSLPLALCSLLTIFGK